ncbi:hypothetical protein LIER_03445 [Lithospermum erythrorhizon]|uniref:Uncharacterized protein n=1 Tax=Lithospermum erythrorhizon TaxID=34254 RepID=A0AAV3NVX5_LITER
MAHQETSSHKRSTLKSGGIVERTLEEGLTFQEPQIKNPEIEEDAEVFAANVLMEPAAEAGRSSKVSASKRRKESGEGPRRKSKKSKVSTIVEGTEGVEGHEEAPVAELGVKDSQTLEGFRNRTVLQSLNGDVRLFAPLLLACLPSSCLSDSSSFLGQLLLFKVDKTLTPSQATEASYAISLQWAESARVAEEFEQELKSNDIATERKLTLELEVVKDDSQKLASNLEESKDELARAQSRLDVCMVKKEDLHSCLTKAEDIATSAVEDFKLSQEYLELLKGNTATLVRGFCQNVHVDFPGISSYFDKYVSDLGEDYVVELFDDLPDDDDEDMGVDEDDENEDEDEDSSDDARGGNGEDDVE